MNVAARPLTGLALCAGIGGLELGVRLALGDAYRLVGAVERDSYAAAVLVARMGEAALDPAPVWDDLATFDGYPWRGRVDLVSAGFPCQPFSAAGQRRSLDDDRWLWPEIARVVREVVPSFVYLENVRGFLAVHGGLGTVLGDLADLGFDAEWTLLSAAALGAPHRRERFWLLAHRHGGRLSFLRRRPHPVRPARDDPDRPGRPAVADPGGPGRPEDPGGAHGHEAPDGRRSPASTHLAHGRGEAVADANGGGREPESRPAADALDTSEASRSQPHPAGGNMADTPGPGPQGGLHRPAERRAGPPERSHPVPGQLPVWPPPPDDHAAWERVLVAGGPQPSVRRMADGLPARMERLHALGNGVAPVVAGAAFLALAHRAGLLEVTE